MAGNDESRLEGFPHDGRRRLQPLLGGFLFGLAVSALILAFKTAPSSPIGAACIVVAIFAGFYVIGRLFRPG